MGCGEGAVIEDLAVGGFAALVGGVPGGIAGLSAEGAVGVDVLDVFRADAANRNGGDGNAAAGTLGLVCRVVELRQFLRRGGGGGLAGLFVMGASGEQCADERQGRATAKTACGRGVMGAGGQDSGPFEPDWGSGPAPGCEPAADCDPA